MMRFSIENDTLCFKFTTMDRLLNNDALWYDYRMPTSTAAVLPVRSIQFGFCIEMERCGQFAVLF